VGSCVSLPARWLCFYQQVRISVFLYQDVWEQ
jgi:hypothetical protein